MYEQSRTETGGKRGGATRSDVAQIIQDQIRFDEAQKHREDLAKANRAKYGSGKYIKSGRYDRMNGKTYDDSKYTSAADKQSYRYGYYGAANLSLFALVTAGKYDDYVPANIEELREKIAKIAENDGMNSEIIFEELPKEVQSNEIYSEYYDSAFLSRNNKTR